MTKNLLTYAVVLVELTILFLWTGRSTTFAQADPLYLREVRAIDTNDFGLLHPTGLAFSFDANLFFVLEARSTTQANIATMTPFEELVNSARVDVSLIDPINLTFDNLVKRLLLFDTTSAELVAIKTGPNGYPNPSPQASTRFELEQLGLRRPRGMTVDPVNGHLFILDSAALQIVRLEPDAEGGFEGAAALNEGRVSRIDLTGIGLVDPRGLAINPYNGHLYLLNLVGQSMYELTEKGQLVAIFRLPPLEFSNPQSLVFALSGDATDDPASINLYIADSGLSGGLNDIGPAPGRIMELTLPVVYVPGDAPTIQAGINLASDGNVVLVAPGLYRENLQIAGKTITLASQFHTTQNPSFIEQTIIDGTGNTVVSVAPSVGPDTRIIGFTIQNGLDGIATQAQIHILNNRIIENSDGIDSTSGGGFIQGNLFEANQDDGIDFDKASSGTIENNLIRHNGDDGIEIRLHAYSGPNLNIIIRHNTITGNDEDGIQLIDYADLSNRVFYIERNLITNNAMVGLGLMDNGDTGEDFRAASIPERIHLFNNTFVDNDYGLTGGDNLIALNNIFVGSNNLAMKNVDGNSMAAYNLFWQNGTAYQNSNVDTAHTLLVNPHFDSNYELLPGSPAIDAGTAFFRHNSEIVLDLQPVDYSGTAPDLGAFEIHRVYLPTILKEG